VIDPSDLTPGLPLYRATSGADGSFAIPGVPTMLGDIGASATLTAPDGMPLSGAAAPVAPVPGGTTEVGDVRVLPAPSIYVSDSTAAGIIRVDPIDGRQQLIAGGGSLRGLRGIAVLRSGAIAVTTDSPVTGEASAVVLVNPAERFDRNQTVMSSGGLLQSPWGIAVEASGTIVVADTNRLIRIDPSLPSPGNQTLVASGVPFTTAGGLAVESDGTIVVMNPSSPGGLIRVNPVTGAQSAVADTGVCPRGVAVDGAGNLVIAGDSQFVFGQFRCPLDAVFRLSGGVRTTVTQSENVVSPRAVTVDRTGRIFVLDGASGTIRVDPATGAQTVIAMPFSGLLTDPLGIAAAPPR
jgi:streptogramin lyase